MLLRATPFGRSIFSPLLHGEIGWLSLAIPQGPVQSLVLQAGLLRDCCLGQESSRYCWTLGSNSVQSKAEVTLVRDSEGRGWWRGDPLIKTTLVQRLWATCHTQSKSVYSRSPLVDRCVFLCCYWPNLTLGRSITSVQAYFLKRDTSWQLCSDSLCWDL